ncbi:MAG: hypothetical protein GY940_06455 [bacterium]|nr:hypothetical protein [bacterium]
MDDLSQRTADSIGEFFKGKYNVKAGIIKYENQSGISDLAAQKFYQLVVAKLESTGTPDPAANSTPAAHFQYTDLMVNFHKSKGEFNLNRVHLLNHLIYLKLTRNKNKIGAGITIFSRISDKIVFVKYVEILFGSQERDIFNTTQFGFKGTGFTRVVELAAQPGLLDFKSVPDAQGSPRFLFYYPKKIELFRMDGSRMSRFFSYPLQWGREYYPVIHPEGKLAVFTRGDALVVTVGSNFSNTAKILVVEMAGQNWKETGTMDFVPFRRIGLNNEDYIAGARYAVGKNYFRGKIVLAPFRDFESGLLSREKKAYPYLLKDVPPFYALDFSSLPQSNALDSIHLVDREYNYHYLADNFEPLTTEGSGQRGSAVCSFDGRWLAVSDFSEGYDTLYFYKIENGSRQLVFRNSVAGEIVFISDGLWKAARGFWVYLKIPKQGASTEYKLQFWSKKSE